MEYWSIGVLEYWSIGVLEYWSIGVIAGCHRNTTPSLHHSITPPLHHSTTPSLRLRPIRPLMAVGGDGHGVGCAVWRDGQVDGLRAALLLEVGDQFVRSVVLLVLAHIAVHLIHR